MCERSIIRYDIYIIPLFHFVVDSNNYWTSQIQLFYWESVNYTHVQRVWRYVGRYIICEPCLAIFDGKTFNNCRLLNTFYIVNHVNYTATAYIKSPKADIQWKFETYDPKRVLLCINDTKATELILLLGNTLNTSMHPIKTSETNWIQ